MKYGLERLFIAAAVTLSTHPTIAADHTKEPLSQVKQNVEKKLGLLVDVREKDEWNSGHIEGALFFPLSGIEDGLTPDELKALPKDKILYVHCAAGFRALTAGDELEKHGYKVRPLGPGYDELLKAGFPKAKK